MEPPLVKRIQTEQHRHVCHSWPTTAATISLRWPARQLRTGHGPNLVETIGDLSSFFDPGRS
jgi:hypothetical protein